MSEAEQKLQETKKWAAKEFGVKPEEVLWYNSGICYDRIGVTTKKAANKVSAKVKGQCVNGGMFDGMGLGSQTLYKKRSDIPVAYYDVMC